MAIKKNEIYSSLWASCDKLRGGMDASQYKDYILTLLFVKYVTDKFKGVKYADITVPEGGSFDDMVALKGTKNIGEGMDKVIGKLAEAGDNQLRGVIDNAHFNDEAKLGKGQEMVDKLTGLISIFQRPEFDFRTNKADGDDPPRHHRQGLYQGHHRSACESVLRHGHPRLKALKKAEADSEEWRVLNEYKELSETLKKQSAIVKELNAALDAALKEKYPALSDAEIKELLVNRKWYYSIFDGIKALYVTAFHSMANRITQLAERYENTLPQLEQEAADYEAKVRAHLERMGFEW